MEFKGIDLGR